MNTHRVCVNTIKGLAMDAVQAANSGHPGMPMGAADMATVLWRTFLKHDPADPSWPDRDRFVLSAGHGSMLLYSLLHLSGYELSLDDIKNFRQWGSNTPGHPEYGHTVGVETTTGPLGQGFAMGVGMAIAERLQRETFGPELVDHHVYAIVGDGCLMEGVSAEAASIAGHLGLGRLIYLYDDNHITIDGGTDLSFSEDVAARFEAYGWHTERVDGHDPEAIARAITAAKAETERPSLLLCRTTIGQSSSIEGTSQTHGAPLGHDEIRATKTRLGMDPDASFAVPKQATDAFRSHEGARLHAAWKERLAAHPKADEFRAWLARDAEVLNAAVEWPSFEPNSSLATRKASAACLKALSAKAPWLVGGSADLAGSNGTNIGATAMSREVFAGANQLHFGVREHAMAAIANGMSLHGGTLPYVATFLVFHDYMRPSVRLSCLMNAPVIYIYTHDSIFLGEDGPTHQPIETLLAMRALPNMRVLRPADSNETRAAWKLAVSHTTGPTALVLTRQNLPHMSVAAEQADEAITRGGYVVFNPDITPDVVIFATGSEVATAIEAAKLLGASGTQARVLSLPWREGFLAQPAAWRARLVPEGVPRVAVEAGVTLGWERYVGEHGLIIGIDTFGASAPANILAEKYGFTPAQIAERIREHIAS